MTNELEQVTTTTTQTPELIPVSRWNDFFPYPSVGSLRQYIFYAHQNGFNKVLRRLGKRLYIKVSAFNEWVETTGQVA